MKNTETKLQEEFIKLSEKNDIDNIDVTLLTKNLRIKRQTFYYHYQSIYDLIYSIYYVEKLDCTEASKFDEIIEQAVNFLYVKKEFNLNVLKSSASSVLKEFLFSYFYRSFNKYLGKYKLSFDEIREYSRFFARAIVEQMLYYFEFNDYLKNELKIKITSMIDEKGIEFLVKK